MTKKTLIVNLYAGPGAGKSTAAAYIFARLKQRGINAEYVTEYAKDVTWEGASDKLKCQIYVTGKQVYRMQRVCGKVDVIVTDSPIALGYAYTDDVLLKKLCVSEARKFSQYELNVFIKRTKKYMHAGRNQTEDEAIKLDSEIKQMLWDNGFVFNETEIDDSSLDFVVDNICDRVYANKEHDNDD